MKHLLKLFTIKFLITLSALGIACSGLPSAKVGSLLSKMTLEEKIGQLNQYSIWQDITVTEDRDAEDEQRYKYLLQGYVGSVLNQTGAVNTCKLQKLVVENSRLGIPLLFALDVIHGFKTGFPIPLAEAASWDLEAISKSASIAAKEAASSGVHWTFSPMVDLARDARWGRVMEGAGEDPYLATLVAKARVEGFQGKDLSDITTIAACAKHFAAYGFAEAGKEYNTTSIGLNILHNVVLPPFKAAVESNVATLMNSFSEIDGVPATASSYLMEDILRSEWGFKGFIVSDWESIGELIEHGLAADKKEAALIALQAGSDMDMESDSYINNLKNLVEEGLIDEKLIDKSVIRILSLKDKLGLLDDPYRYCNAEREKATLLHPDHVAASRDIARKSIVLLKNEKNLLPIRNVRRIALIGPLAKDKDDALGNWRARVDDNSVVSLYEGLEAALANGVQLSYAEGCKLSIAGNKLWEPVVLETNDRSGFDEAKRVAQGAELVIIAAGEPAFMSGEARSRTDLSLPGLQPELIKEIYSVNKNIVLVMMNGRPLTIPWEAENLPAIVDAWHLGSEAGNAIADVLLGKYNPSGKLPISFPRTVGQCPIYYNRMNTGRPSGQGIFHSQYIDTEAGPLFPFGFGLSYTTFDYSNFNAEKAGDTINVLVRVTNSGEVHGEEVVQLYIQDPVASITRPVKELKAFKKIHLAAGAHEDISFELTKADLSFYKNAKLTFEPGKFNIMVGGDSNHILVKEVTFTE